VGSFDAATIGGLCASYVRDMSMSGPYQTDPYRRGSALSRSFLPLALITLGVVFLLGNVIPERGRTGLVVLGLGAAFMVGRVATGRYGYAVPAGLLIAVGTYISLQHVQEQQSVQGAGWFFVLLGLGFVLVYLIGLRPAAVWPLFPATVLIGLGLVLFGVGSLGALSSLSWIVAYWPAGLVLLGLWLLFRDQIPVAARRPIATLGGIVLLAYGVLAAAASVATGAALTRTGVAASFGPSPFADTVTLDAPIASGATFSVDNPNGRTTIHAGNSSTVHVVATKHYSIGGQAPDVHLTQAGNGVMLSSSNPRSFPFGGSSSWVEYSIEVPANVQVKAQSASGTVDVDGVSGAVQADTSSGAVSVANLGGSVQAHSSSGSIQLSNIGGEVRVTTSSGQVRGTELRHVREASSNSGSISLEGTFTDPAQIRASSGSVNLKLLPDSAIQLDVKTGSGSVIPQNLILSGGATRRNSLSGNLGTPAPGAVLSVQTTSGSVTISQ
jgi:hypothetical protein